MIKEYIIYSVNGINLLSTILFSLIILYWILVIFGVMSSDSINLDFGVDDVELDSDFDSDIESTSSNFFIKVLTYSNFGLIPFMVYLSFFSIAHWVLTMLSYYLKINPNSIFALLIFFINLILSFFVTKIVTTPFLTFFEGLESKKAFEPIGKEGVLTTDLDINHLGTIVITEGKGETFLLNVISNDKVYKKGDKVRILSKLEERDVYLVE